MTFEPMAVIQLVLAIAGGAIAGERYVNARFDKLAKELQASLDELNEDTAKLQTGLEVMQERTASGLKIATGQTEKQLIRLDSWCKNNHAQQETLKKELKLLNARLLTVKETLDDVQLFMVKNFSYVIRKQR